MIVMSYIPEQVKLCLKDLVERLGKHKIRYVVIGALPVHFYGRPYYNEKMVMKFIDNITKSGVDILLHLSTAGLSRESLKRLKKVEVDGVLVAIPCPEDYIISKLKARRPDNFDFSDVMSVLLNMREELDWDYLMKRAEEEGLAHLIRYYKEGVR
jgi:predicted nucleotidyltransferase